MIENLTNEHHVHRTAKKDLSRPFGRIPKQGRDVERESRGDVKPLATCELKSESARTFSRRKNDRRAHLYVSLVIPCRTRGTHQRETSRASILCATRESVAGERLSRISSREQRQVAEVMFFDSSGLLVRSPAETPPNGSCAQAPPKLNWDWRDNSRLNTAFGLCPFLSPDHNHLIR